MGLLARIKVWVSGEILTASDLNAEFDNVLDNGLVNDKITGSSADVTAMRVVVDPGEVGTESLASSNDGEIKRLRNMIKEITNKTQWYESPDFDIDNQLLTSTSTDPDVTGIRLLLMDTSGGTRTIETLQNGVDRQIVTIFKTDGTNTLTISDNGTGSGDVIRTHTDTDIDIEAAREGGVTVVFNSSAGFWTVIDRTIATADIIANAITTVKITDLNVTRAKLVAVGEQVSTNSGTFTTSSSSLVDITNLSVTITTTGRPVMLFLTGDGATTSFLQVLDDNSSGTTQAVLAFDRGGSSIATFLFGVSNGTAGIDPIYAPGQFLFLDTPSAATHTYKARIQANTTGDSVAVTRVTLVAYEL